MDALGDAAKTFDTSGKSAALVHHRPIRKTSMALPGMPQSDIGPFFC